MPPPHINRPYDPGLNQSVGIAADRRLKKSAKRLNKVDLMNNKTASGFSVLLYADSSGLSKPVIYGVVGKSTDWRTLEPQATLAL
jgi:hypothetical protein